jgi:hypothetical protein
LTATALDPAACRQALWALVGAALCLSLLAVFSATVLVQQPAPSQLQSIEAPGSSIAGPAADIAAPAAGIDRSDPVNTDVTVRPKVDGIGVRHVWRKPRRTNRRLRVPGRAIGHSGSARTGTLGISSTQLTLKRKRTSKRSLMRRLIAVRGGLQA